MNPADWFDLTGHRFFVIASYAISFAVIVWMAGSTWLRDRRVHQQIRAEINNRNAAP